MILIETRRLRLRAFTPEDCLHLNAIDNDPDVMRYINGGIDTPMDVTQSKILPLFLTYDTPTGFGFWAVEERLSGEFLGWVCLRRFEIARDAMIGYRFYQASWGQGFATEATQALIDKAFTSLSINRIYATTYEHNQASRRVMEKLGLSFFKTFNVDLTADSEGLSTAHYTSDDIWDGEDVEYELLKTDWLRLQSMQTQP